MEKKENIPEITPEVYKKISEIKDTIITRISAFVRIEMEEFLKQSTNYKNRSDFIEAAIIEKLEREKGKK